MRSRLAHDGPATPPRCPECGGAMKRREGSRGPFLGCVAFPSCRGTRKLHVTAAPADDADLPRDEAPGLTDVLITDLRRAAEHLGVAVDILRRHAPELDRLLPKVTDATGVLPGPTFRSACSGCDVETDVCCFASLRVIWCAACYRAWLRAPDYRQLPLRFDGEPT